jgi:hypothetical protein
MVKMWGVVPEVGLVKMFYRKWGRRGVPQLAHAGHLQVQEQGRSRVPQSKNTLKGQKREIITLYIQDVYKDLIFFGRNLASY